MNIPWTRIVETLKGELKGLLNRIRTWSGSRWRRTKLDDYYYSGGETDKNLRAKGIDRLFLRGLLFLTILLTCYFLTENFIVGALIGVLGVTVFHMLAKGRRKARISTNKEKMFEKEAIHKFLCIAEEKGPKEFFQLIGDLLNKSGLFSELRLIEDDKGNPLIITGNFKAEKVGIYGKKLGPERMVKKEDLEEFVSYCQSRGLENGVYIANGIFDYRARGYAAGLDVFNLLLADTEVLYRGFLKQGFLFSMEELQGNMEQLALEQSHGAQHSLKKILALRRVKTYGVLSVIIAVYSVMVPYTLYYIFVSIVLLCLSATALVRWEIERHREDAENSIKLDRVMDME